MSANAPITIPDGAFLIPANLSSTHKTFTLPVVSTNIGRTLIFKDMFGNAPNSTIRLSTIGLDRIERDTVSSMVLSNTYGAWTFMNDGITEWYLTNAYTNNLFIFSNVPIVERGLTFNLDAATYTGGATWVALVGNNFNLSNSPTTDLSPGGQTVLVFNGTNQFAMDQTGTTVLTTFSFDIWFWSSNINGTILSEMGQAGAPNTGYRVANAQVVNGLLRVGFWTGAATSISLGNVSINTWNCVSWTYSPSVIRGYLNGVFITSNTQTKSAPSRSYYSIASAMAQAFGTTAALAGRIGALKFYNVVLTANEVRQNYNAFATRYGRGRI